MHEIGALPACTRTSRVGWRDRVSGLLYGLGYIKCCPAERLGLLCHWTPSSTVATRKPAASNFRLAICKLGAAGW